MDLLESYRAQREIVATTLAANPEAEGMKELFDSLTELISLIEDEQNTLPISAEVSGRDNETSSSSESDVEDGDLAASESDEPKRVPGPSTSISSVHQELIDSLEHMQCRVPFQHDWGQMSYSNAIVQSVESTPGSSTDVHEVHVRVLFMQPTHRKMIPCKFYLDGRCRFVDKQCHFSHGEVYPLSKIKPYKPPDFSGVRNGSHVLCQNDDGIWERGIVKEIQEATNADENVIMGVLIDGQQESRQLSLHQVIPEELENHSERLLDLSDDQCNDLVAEDNGDGDSEFIPHDAWNLPVNQVGGDFAGWEVHTKGVASKLMARMGFIAGQSLGTRSGGMTEPIIAQVFPKGRSLDYCMEMKDQKDFVKSHRDRRKSGKNVGKRKKSKLGETKRTKQDIFSIINSQMSRNHKKCGDHVNEEKPPTKHSDVKEQNIELIKLQDKICMLEKDLTRLRGSLLRNKASDKAAANVITEKITMQEHQLVTLKRKYNLILQEQSKQKDRKSMAVF